MPKGSCPACTGALLYLKGLDEGPKQDADGVALAKQLDQPCCPEEAEEAQVDEVVLQEEVVFPNLWNPSQKSTDKLLPSYNLSPSPVPPKEMWLKEIKMKSLL